MKVSMTICVVLLLYIHTTICQDYVYEEDPYNDNDFGRQMGNIGKIVNRQVNGLLANLDQQLSKLNIGLKQELEKVDEELSGLGERIEKQVAVSLEPLNAEVIKSLMAQGVGGVTLATYGDKIQLVVKNKVKYTCTGKIYTDEQTKEFKCTEAFVEQPQNNIHVCTDSLYSNVNNYYCFGKYKFMQCINNECICNGGVLYTLEYLKKQCGDTFGTNTYVKYQYQANSTNPNRIPIPNQNKYVTCEENVNGRCTWYGSGFLFGMEAK